jgi:ATP-dependent Clp protease ATP-binding subunit ClpA
LLSNRIQSYLEREIVGQSRAVNTLTRTLTVAFSGLDDPDATMGSYLLLGPSGTGKTLIARSLARMLHDRASRLAIIDCRQLTGSEDLHFMARQIAPQFQPSTSGDDGVMLLPPYSILLVERVEAAKPEFIHAIMGIVESGQMVLPDGQRGILAGCLVLMTSNLCSGEIQGEEPKEIGFSTGGPELEEREKARIFEICASTVEKRWGPSLFGHLDDMIVFHRLRDRHFPMILDRQVGGLNRQLAARGIQVELGPEARSFLLARGAGFPEHGAWFLAKSFRRFVLFPLADLLADGLPSGSYLQVDVESTDRLRFVVTGSRDAARAVVRGSDPSIPIQWEEVVSG